MSVSTTKDGSETAGVQRHLLSVAAVAAVFGISKRSVWRLIAAGDLKPVRINRAVRIQVSEVEAFIARGGCTHG